LIKRKCHEDVKPEIEGEAQIIRNQFSPRAAQAASQRKQGEQGLAILADALEINMVRIGWRPKKRPKPKKTRQEMLRAAARKARKEGKTRRTK